MCLIDMHLSFVLNFSLPDLLLRNPSKTKELDWSCTPRKLTIENSSRREDEGKRTRGKPSIKMLDRIMTEGHTKLSYDELKSAAQDRLKWRHHYQDLPTQADN